VLKMVQPAVSFRQEIENTFSKQNVATFAKRVAADTATSTLATAVFTSFNPISGLIIGAVSHPTTKLINWICDKLHVGENSIITKITARVLSILTGIALGTMLAQAAGFHITFFGACVISLSGIGLYVLAGALAIGAIALSVLIAQTILKAMPKDNSGENRARAAIERFRTTANDILHNRLGIDRLIHELTSELRHMVGLEEVAAEFPSPAEIPPPYDSDAPPAPPMN
jgi:hypothetical protein